MNISQDQRPGPPSLRDFFEDQTLALIYRLCHNEDKSNSEVVSVRNDHCEKVSIGIGLAAILLIRRHRGYCSLRLSGALHGLWKWIDSEFEEDEVIYSVKEHDDLVECAEDLTNSNDDIIVDLRINLMFVAPERECFKELLTRVLKDLAKTDKRYKNDIASQLITEIVEYVPPEESDTFVSYSSEDPRSTIRRGVESEINKPESTREITASTRLLDTGEKQKFVSLMMKLVESSNNYISDSLDDHNDRIDAAFSDLFIESTATPLVRLSTIYERSAKVLDRRGFRTLLIKYRQYIEDDFENEIVIARSEEIDRHSLNVTHRNVVTETDLWSLVVAFCNLLKKEDVTIFLEASSLLLRILSQFTDDIHEIQAGKISAGLRRRTKRISDDLSDND